MSEAGAFNLSPGYIIERELAEYSLGIADFALTNGHREWALDNATDPMRNHHNELVYKANIPFLKIYVQQPQQTN